MTTPKRSSAKSKNFPSAAAPAAPPPMAQSLDSVAGETRQSRWLLTGLMLFVLSLMGLCVILVILAGN